MPTQTYGYDFPSDWDLNSADYPVLTGLGGGVAAYRSNQSEQFQSDNPDYAGEYRLGFENAPGIRPGYNELNPAPGSTSLIAPRNSGETVGTDRIIQSDGPVTGKNSEFTGLRSALYTPNPNYSGPVTGGPDYAQQLAATYFASLAQLYSAEASASALVSAV
jgi:hypothetical protein